MAITIPRLPPANNPYELNVTVNVNLLPYFQIWFQRKKLDGETTEQFALRHLKAAALNAYMADAGQAEVNAIEATKAASIDELNGDIQVLNTEID